MNNHNIAEELTRQANWLEKESTNLYRVMGYRRAANTISRLSVPVSELLETQGTEALERLPSIGKNLAFAIERLVTTGNFHTFTEQAHQTSRDDHVRDLTGVGPHTAQLLWEELGVQTISELEEAIEAGKLEDLPIGPRKRARLVAAIAEHRTQLEATKENPNEPSVAELLSLDEVYREKARNKKLPTIAPFHKNPKGEKWLPIFATRRGAWQVRALFSNTAHAHRKGRTNDWVVIYFQADTHEGQRTVVTEEKGDLKGFRVVKGREEECREFYKLAAYKQAG
ncbi:MAG: DNA-binding protein [Gemmataceae bacterium]